jgi:hypothetical protein
MKRLRIVGLVNGGSTPFDNQWLVSYDPDYHLPDGSYDGSDLRTSPDEADARQFADVRVAVDYWRQSHGTRIDGKPNRPLTAFNVEIV